MKQTAILLILFSMMLASQWVYSKSTVKIGVLAYRPIAELETTWGNLASVLNSSISEHQFEILFLDNKALDLAVASRNLDYVFTTSGNYIYLNKRYGLSAPLLMLVKQYRQIPLRAYGGVIFTTNNHNDINELSDIAEKKIASIGKAGMGGYKLQIYELFKQSVAEPEQYQLLITGQPQTRVVDAVMTGKADVGFVRAGVLEVLADQGKLDLSKIKIINAQRLPGYPYLSSTPLYPEWPMAALQHVDNQLTRKITGLLLSLSHGEGFTKNTDLFGFDIPANYQVVEQLMRDLRVPPFETSASVSMQAIWDTYHYYVLMVLLVLSGLSVTLVISFKYNQKLSSAHNVISRQNKRLSDIISATKVGTWEWNIKSGEVIFNEQWAEMIGYTLAELQPTTLHTWLKLVHPDDLEKTNDSLGTLYNKEKPNYQWEIRLLHKNGHWIWVQDRGSVMEWSSDGKPLLMAGTHLDITTRKRYEEKLKYLSVHDPLTGLFNRQELRNLLEKEMQRARRYQRDLSVCMIDIDHFKKINDTYGHPVGDKVLTILASIIKKTIRENDIAFRYGGEEFLIVLTETPVPQALSLAERLRKSIEAYEFKDSKEAEFNATVSIGVATFTEQIKSEEELLKTADQALYAAKKAGRNQVMSFEQSLLN